MCIRRRSTPACIALLAVVMAFGAGARVSAAAGEGDRFAELLQAMEPNACDDQLAQYADQLARAPQAIESYLAIVASGQLSTDPAHEPVPLTQLQRKLLARIAPMLPAAQIGPCVRSALEDSALQLSWRRAALELFELHANASDLPLMVRLVSDAPNDTDGDPTSTGEDLSAAFREAATELLRREPRTLEELHLAFATTEVEMEIVRAVGLSGQRRAAPWLVERLADPDLVDVALQELARIAPTVSPQRALATAAALRPFLSSESSMRRAHAMRALAQLDDADAVPRMLELLEHVSTGERARIFAALRQLSGCGLPDRAEAWTAWFAAEQRWWDTEASAALERLSSLDDAIVVAAIRDVSQRSLRRNQVAARLVALLRDPGATSVRCQVCVALARLRSRAFVDDLVTALQDADAAVGESALQALQSITGLDLPADALAWSSALQH